MFKAKGSRPKVQGQRSKEGQRLKVQGRFKVEWQEDR